MPEEGLEHRLAYARRLATEARLDRLDTALAGIRADAVTVGGVPADLEIELAVLSAFGRINLERAAEAWDALQAAKSRLVDASPVLRGRFHTAAGRIAYGFGDEDSAIDETVLGLAEIAGEPPSAERALALAAAAQTLAYTRLFPLAAEVMDDAIGCAEKIGLPSARLHSQAVYVHLTWGLSLDHLGLADGCTQRWADVERHHELATTDPDAVPDTLLAFAHAHWALALGRLGHARTARHFLTLARAARDEPRPPSLRRALAHAEGAALAAEGRSTEARDALLELWESVRHGRVPARTEDVPLLLARVCEAAGRPAEALSWYREVYSRYGRTQQEAWLARETAARLRVEQEALVRRSRELEADALTDPLTGVPNRRAFDVELVRLVTEARSAGNPLTLAVLDVDRFKRINDLHGHPIGDEVLRAVGRIVRDGSGEGDRYARYGGDEFVLCLAAPAEEAEGVVGRLASAVADHPWEQVAPDLRVTISAGLGQLDREDTATSLFYAADQSLLAAKRSRPPDGRLGTPVAGRAAL
ncbi:MAG TPA: GGDEF domain-containing protein [Mycobacteriales bacterium]